MRKSVCVLVAGLFILFNVSAQTAPSPEEAQLREQLLDTEARRQEITGEASPELVSLNLSDTGVSLLLSGFWKGSLLGKWGVSKSKLGWTIAPTDSPILFTQEADLTLSLWVNERWFVEANFQEDYDVNTYRAGYQGQGGEFVRYAAIGNTGLGFPLFPYLDLGGDSTSSLGFYGAFGSGPLSFHTLIRYDAAEREERVFVGSRERAYAYLSAANMLHGVSFVLPDENIVEPPTVLLEDEEGPYTGAGKRWRMALPSEVAVSAREGLVEFAETPKGMAAVYYPGGYNMGAYNVPGTFLGDVQDFFQGVDLAAYPQCGGRAGAPALIQINDILVMVIYERGTFSPFEKLNRYAAPASSAVNVTLVNTSTKEPVSGWELFRLDESPVGALPLYVNEETSAAVYQREVYQLTRSGPQLPRSPDSRWPLAYDKAGAIWLQSLYLPVNSAAASDAELRWTSYSSQTGYALGSDILPGSITVLRGGISDPYWTFDEVSGTVRLQTPAQFNEIIKISYLRRSLDRRNGSIAAGLGAVYQSTGHFSARAALGLRWNAGDDGYSEAGETSPGFAGAGGRLSWDFDTFKADISLGAGFEQPDTTGLYRAAGMEGHENVFELPESSFLSNLPPSASILPELLLINRAPLVYRNYRSTNFAGITTLMPIENSAPVVASISGPYPARDDTFGARILAAEFEFTGNADAWTGFQSPLEDKVPLALAEKMLVPFRFYEMEGAENLKIFVQLGPLAPKDSSQAENKLLIVEKEITTTQEIMLTAEDRRRLRGATFIRYIITGSAAARGRVLFAPPVFLGAKFTLLLENGYAVLDNFGAASVAAVETIDNELAQKYNDTIKRLHPAGEKQRVLLIDWSGGAGLDPGLGVGAGGRTGMLPLDNYKKLSFFVKVPALANGASNAGSLDFYAAHGRSSYLKNEETALEAHIPAEDLTARGGASWVKIELRYSGSESGVFIDGNRIENATLIYRPSVFRRQGEQANEEGAYTGDAYLMFFLRPKESSASLAPASMSIDEVILEEGDPSYYVNSGLRLKWNLPGTIVEAGSVRIIEDFTIETALETSARGNPLDENKAGYASTVNRSYASFSLLGVQLSGDLSFSISQSDAGHVSWWSAGHAVSRAFGPFSLQERFFLDPSGGVWNHQAAVRLANPFVLSFEADSQLNNIRTERSWRSNASVTEPGKIPLHVAAAAHWRWTENSDSVLPDSISANYGKIWTESAAELLPDAGEGADRRTMQAQFETRWSAKPVGAGLLLHANMEAAAPAQRTQKALRAELSFPWQLGKWGGSFRIERKLEHALFLVSGNAGGDLLLFGETLAASSALFAEPPFFALFDRDLPAKLNSSFESLPDADLTSGGATGDKYSAAIQFPAVKGLASFFLPHRAEAHIDRNIVRRLDTLQDILGAGGNLQFSAVNIFGAYGTAKLFKFYQNDEFRQTLSAAYARPRFDKSSWRLRAEQTAIFYGFRGAELHLGDTITILSSGWLFGVNLEWITPAEKTLLSGIYDWVMRRFQNEQRSPALAALANARYERLRKEKLQIDFDHSGKKLRYAVQAEHESIVRITGRINLSAFANLSCSQNVETEILNFIASIGTSLQVYF